MNSAPGLEHIKKIWLLGQVLKTKSLRSAALAAKVTPSAVSQAITSLEKVVGRPLLIRKDGKVEPTEASIELLRQVGPALEALANIGSLKASQVPEMAWLSFGTYESLAVELVPEFMDRLMAKLPKTKLTVRVARTATLATLVRKGELCVALVPESDSIGNLDTLEVGRDRLGLFATSQIAQTWAGSWVEGTHRIGMLSPGTDGYPTYHKKFVDRAFGSTFKPSLLSDSLEALRAAAAAGAVIAVLPRAVALRNSGELVELSHAGSGISGLGVHKLLLISLPTCDPAEVRFLEKELRSLLLERAHLADTQEASVVFMKGNLQ